MIPSLLRLILPPHLDWLAPLAARILDTIDDAIDAGHDGWTEADDKALAAACAGIAADLAHGIRNATQAAPPKRGRWRARGR